MRYAHTAVVQVARKVGAGVAAAICVAIGEAMTRRAYHLAYYARTIARPPRTRALLRLASARTSDGNRRMSRAPWITRAQVDHVARLLADGITVVRIARLTGLSMGTVSNIKQGKMIWKRPRSVSPA